MQIEWTNKAASDVTRLYEFMASVNKPIAVKLAKDLVNVPNKLAINPRLGEQLCQFNPREVRRILWGNYEIRYEIQQQTIFILRLWHTRENRS